jgi:hypothetical protein
MAYSKIKELYENIDSEVIREYYEDYSSAGLSILSAALHLGIDDELGNQYEYLCDDGSIDEHKEYEMEHMNEEEKDDWLVSHNGWWFIQLF